jgi:hypothetical protein
MLAQFVNCVRCGLRALVRVSTGGRTSAKRTPDELPTQVVDCPSCGVHEQPTKLPSSDLTATTVLNRQLPRNLIEKPAVNF